MNRVTRLVVTIILGGGLSACSAVIDNHGYAPDEQAVAEIEVGKDTRGSVRSKIGRPSSSGVFTREGWYYVSTRVGRYMYHAPKVTDRRVVAVRFDPDDVVVAVNIYGLDDGRLIDLQTRTTPTQGRDLTILQQILGNLGTLSGEQLLNK